MLKPIEVNKPPSFFGFHKKTDLLELKLAENSEELEKIKVKTQHLVKSVEEIKKHQLKESHITDVLMRSTDDLHAKNVGALDTIISEKIESYFYNSSLRSEPVKKKPLFLIGSGPSLAQCDVSKLKNCYTMSFNRSYIAFKDWGFEPTYFAGIDTIVNEDNLNEFRDLLDSSNIQRFFFNRSSFTQDHYLSARTTLVELGLPSNPNLDFTKKLRTANTGLFGLQVALGLLGFKEVYLLGCDANYEEKIKGTVINGPKVAQGPELLSNEDSDSNHFRSDYFGKGRRYHRPEAHLYHFPAWKAFYEQVIKNNSQGMKVYNCSKTGRLTFFEYKDFDGISKNIRKFERD